MIEASRWQIVSKRHNVIIYYQQNTSFGFIRHTLQTKTN